MTAHAPLSDRALQGWPKFTDTIRKRLEKGKQDYGDTSFNRPLSHLVNEIQQELEDVSGWSFILHNRLEEILTKVKQLEEKIDGAPVSPITFT